MDLRPVQGLRDDQRRLPHVTAEGAADITSNSIPQPGDPSDGQSHRRPVRNATIAVSLVLLFLISLRIGWGWYAHRQIQQIIALAHRQHEPASVEDLAAQASPSPTGAAAVYTSAMTHLKLSTPRWTGPKSYVSLPAPDDATGNKMAGDVARNAALLAQLRAARDLPTGFWGPPLAHPVRSAFMLRFSGIFPLSNLLAWQLCLNHVKGNDDEALETAQDWLKYGQVIDARAGLGGLRWSALAIQRDALEALRAIAPSLRISENSSEGSISRQQVRGLIEKLLDEREVQEGGARAWFFMRVVALDEAQPDEVDAHAGNALLGRLLQPAFDLRAARDARRANAFATAASWPNWPEAQSHLPAEVEQVEPWLQSAARAQVDYDRLDPSQISEQFHVLTERRATATILAMRLYAEDHDGQYPQALSQLVPKYLPDLPLDPMAAHNRPMLYQMPQGQRATVFLYSVGNNGIDDGGPAAHVPVRDLGDGLWVQADVIFAVPPTSTQIALPSTRQAQDHT